MNTPDSLRWHWLLAFCLTGSVGCATLTDREAGAMERAAATGSPLVGQTAPVFALSDQDDRPTALRDLRGRWVVLYFYPADDTPGCTCQATEFTRLLSRFHRLDADVLGVSPNTTDSHRRFRQKYGIQITLLADPDHSVARSYGAWNQLGWQNPQTGRIVRSTVLIDPNGVIAHHWPEVIPKGHADRVRRRLVELQRQGAGRS